MKCFDSSACLWIVFYAELFGAKYDLALLLYSNFVSCLVCWLLGVGGLVREDEDGVLPDGISQHLTLNNEATANIRGKIL